MISRRLRSVLMAGFLGLWPLAQSLHAGDETSGPLVTLSGNVVCSRAMSPQPWFWDPKDGDHTPVLFAIEGTPEVETAVRTIMAGYPDRGLDVENALRIQDAFTRTLKYALAPGPITDRIHKEIEAGTKLLAVTGTLLERDGIRWIRVTRSEPARVRYPAAMLAPDRPFAPAGKDPLVLRVNETLTMKCVLLPAGRFLQGSPFYQRRYQDEYPHEVVLTRPFYMAETPVTQEVFEAVMGKNPSASKGPRFPVERVPFAEIEEFCSRLSQRSGRTVRLPSDAEWEYAARVGTSNPCFPEKYVDQASDTGAKPNTTPVATRQPNAWGLHDMLCRGWHVTHDYKADNVRVRQVDPTGPAADDKDVHRDKTGRLHKSRGGRHYDHIRPNIHGAIGEDGSIWESGMPIFRVVVSGE